MKMKVEQARSSTGGPLPTERTLDAPGGRIVIRPAEPADAAGWIKLMSDVAAEGRYIAVERVEMTKRSLARNFRLGTWTPARGAIAALEGQAVVGELTLFREHGIHRHTAELGMSVAATHRRIGVGTALIEGALDWARAFDVEKISLHVFPHNERAISLYRKMGFEQEGLRHRQAKLSYGYEDLILMARFV